MIYKKFTNLFFLIIYSILILLSLNSLIGAIIYYFYKLNNIAVVFTLIISFTIFIIAQKKYKIISATLSIFKNNNQTSNLNTSNSKKNKIINYFLFFAYLITISLCFYILFKNNTVSSISSPWQVLPKNFFVLYSLATLLLLFIIVRQNKSHTLDVNPIILIILYYFLSFSIILIIYQLNYGFDSFIHQATEKLINSNGAVTPKPLYYLGQYSLVVILHKITGLSISLIDKLITPLLSSIYLPLTFYLIVQKFINNNFIKLKNTYLTSLFILALPYSFFTFTTPQNLGYFYLVLIILLSLKSFNKNILILMFLFSFTALLIHPLAGVPAVLFSFLILIQYVFYNKKVNKNIFALFGAVIFLTIISIPLMFYYVQYSIGSKMPTIKNAKTQIQQISNNFPWQQSFILNFIYFYKWNLIPVIFFLVILGIILYFKDKKINFKQILYNNWFAYFLMSISLYLSYLLTKFLNFNFLINYERSIFPKRVLIIATLFLLPFIILTIYKFIEKILKSEKIIKYPMLLFIASLICSSFYLSYPRFDNYENSHAHSTSISDIKAVKWIEKNAHSNNYIVLANQQVSAAAINEFGFKKYYKIINKNTKKIEQIFYYPIPTGNILYQYYLRMVYDKPLKKTAKQAMSLVNADKAYFVLNKYWWAYDKIVAQAKLQANKYKDIDKKIMIFEFQ